MLSLLYVLSCNTEQFLAIKRPEKIDVVSVHFPGEVFLHHVVG